LGLEIRSGNADLRKSLVSLIDADAWLAVHAERAVARVLGGSCSMPLAAFATRGDDGRFTLRAALGDAAVGAALEVAIGQESPQVTARPLLRASETAALADVAAAEALGARVAAALLAAGGQAYLPTAGA
jgi:hydroxymethylbilane synthase